MVVGRTQVKEERGQDLWLGGDGGRYIMNQRENGGGTDLRRK